MKKLLLSCLLSLCALPSWADNWIPVGRTNDSIVSLSPDYIGAVGYTRTVAVKEILSTKNIKGKRNIGDFTMTIYSIDCNSR